MRFSVAVFALSLIAGALAGVNRPDDVSPYLDCQMRQLAYEYAMTLQPWMGKQQATFDALELGVLCQSPRPANTPPPPPSHPVGRGAVFVDTHTGSDNNDGSKDKPFKTIQRGLDAVKNTKSSVVLREGTFYLDATLQMTPDHSGTTLQNYPGEKVWLSGGQQLDNLEWKAYNVTPGGQFTLYPNDNNVWDGHPDGQQLIDKGKTANVSDCQSICASLSVCQSFTWHDPNQGKFANDCWIRTTDYWVPHSQTGHISGRKNPPRNIWVADVSKFSLSSMPGLRVNGNRAIRARFPNANPETQGIHTSPTGWIPNAEKWLPPTAGAKATDVEVKSPQRNNSIEFQTYKIGIGGVCGAQFEPPCSYWCSSNPQGGGAVTYKIPSGLTYKEGTFDHKWANPKGAVIQAWRHSHWASWMFEMDTYDPSSRTIKWTKGGFQGARGCDQGQEYYVENIMEELDFPTEYFFSSETQQLFYYHNSTNGEAPPKDTVFVATQIRSLLNITSADFTRETVKNVTVIGLGFRDARYTYMDPHGVPSGGDWALQRSGAVFLEGTESTQIRNCVFERIDGNALMISGYNRYAQVTQSEFSWIGDSAIASWGKTDELGNGGLNGINGTDGNQPRFNQITHNYVHELGIWEKQSSFYFQGKTCQSNITGNIFFNGPRAGINFNDGFGGASHVTHNLLFNTCRESADHGPFNSWDRQPFLTTVYNGTPSLLKATDEIAHNYFIANYNSQEAVDNDDGSGAYRTHHNVFYLGGGGLKNDFGGHSNHHTDNLYAYVDSHCMRDGTTQLPGNEDAFQRNTCIMKNDGEYASYTCSGNRPVVSDNKVYTPSGDTTECGKSLADLQKEGYDLGSAVYPLPNDDDVVSWARALLSS